MGAKSPDNFMVSRLLGEDNDSTVVLARDIETDVEYAIKIIEKRLLVKEDKKAQFDRERRIISLLDHQFFVKLHHIFEDEKRLYFAMSYANNGDLLSLIEKYSRLNPPCAQYYAAELVSALEYMKGLNIVHRDLKPENILLTSSMHINISDFGTAIILPETEPKRQKRKTSFVGTANYVPPELLVDKYSNINSDLWSLGCIIFQMLAGTPPFDDSSDVAIFQKIIKIEYKLPDVVNGESADLIRKLLNFDSEQRIGADAVGGFAALKNHAFFEGIQWEHLHNDPPPPATPPPSRLSSRYSSGGSEASQSRRSTEARLSPRKDGTMRRQTKQDSSSLGILQSSEPDDIEGYGIPLEMSQTEREKWMEKQLQSTWHHFTNGALILKLGQLEKKRGLSSKIRQFILMEGPRLIYVDAGNMEVKGEIPWSRELKTEVKSFKSFLIHVPGRTYHIFDKKGNAIKWCRKIDKVKQFYFNCP